MIPTSSYTWSQHPVVKDYFWDRALKSLVEAGSSFEYRSPHSSDSGVTMNKKRSELSSSILTKVKGQLFFPKFVLRMGVERKEVPFYIIKF